MHKLLRLLRVCKHLNQNSSRTMEYEPGKQKQTERKRKAMTLFSRRDFLSSVTVTGAAVVLSGALPSAMAVPQESVTPPARAALPPPAGQEASYQWYLGQD